MKVVETSRDALIDAVVDEIGREYLRISDRFGFKEPSLLELLKFHYPVGYRSLEAMENEVSQHTDLQQLKFTLHRYRQGYMALFEKISILYGGQSFG